MQAPATTFTPLSLWYTGSGSPARCVWNCQAQCPCVCWCSLKHLACIATTWSRDGSRTVTVYGIEDCSQMFNHHGVHACTFMLLVWSRGRFLLLTRSRHRIEHCTDDDDVHHHLHHHHQCNVQFDILFNMTCSARAFGVGLFKRLACTCISNFLATYLGQVIQDCSHTLNVASSRLKLLTVNETLAAATFRHLCTQASLRASLYALMLACTCRMHSRS